MTPSMLHSLHLDGSDRPVAVLAEGPALRLRRDGIADAFAPLPRLSRVQVHGTRVHWRTEALTACMEAGVPVLFLGAHGRLIGACVPVAPPTQRADLAALLDARAVEPGFRARLEDFCRAEERRALLNALATAGGPLRAPATDLRPGPLRQAWLADARDPAAAAAVHALMRGLCEALVSEALARRGVGLRFLARRTGGFPLPAALGGVLSWRLWPAIRRLAETGLAGATGADGAVSAAMRRAVIIAFEQANLVPARDQLLARLAATLADGVP
jgi:hypothetical protein